MEEESLSFQIKEVRLSGLSNHTYSQGMDVFVGDVNEGGISFISKKGKAELANPGSEYKLILKGNVVSSKGNKTIVVEVKRRFKHPFYGKIISRSKKYHAHDENNKFKEGDEVKIIESKPISKLKTWQVIEK